MVGDNIMFNSIKNIFTDAYTQTDDSSPIYLSKNFGESFDTVVETVVEPKKEISMDDIIRQIHMDFHESQDELNKLAQELKSEETTMQKELEEAKILRELGFHKTKNVKTSSEEEKRLDEIKKENAKKLLLKEAIDYFTQKYPCNRFITVEKVYEICEKYGLVLGKNSDYKGEVPSKNLQHILNFKLDSEIDALYVCGLRLYYCSSDKGIQINVGFSFGYITILIDNSIYNGNIIETFKKFQEIKDIECGSKKDLENISEFLQMLFCRNENIEGVTYTKHIFGNSSDSSSYQHLYSITKANLEMVAPVTDFDMSNKRVVGHQLTDIPAKDPIVLQPVCYKNEKYYLIVTAWGLEASDESVLNPVMN